MRTTGRSWRTRWWTPCWRSTAASLAAWGILAAGCTRKDPSEKDVRRAEVADLEREDGGAATLAAILADLREDDLVRAQAAASLGSETFR
ncbi:MAG: hypothetical protein HUU15_20205, partial [Candidatus Brocadiae bacterium]|nr:hypothetical protein [Candidatus Brocadiia bacterium]